MVLLRLALLGAIGLSAPARPSPSIRLSVQPTAQLQEQQRQPSVLPPSLSPPISRYSQLRSALLGALRLGVYTSVSPHAQPPLAEAQSPLSRSPIHYRQVAMERKSLLANGLAFLSGLADVATFSAAGCYACMMTGNTIAMVTALVGYRILDSLFFFAMVSHYVVGVAAFRLLNVRKGLVADAIAPCIIALFAVVDGLMHLTASRWSLLILAASFGYINSLSSERTGLITCMVTGHFQKLGNTLADAANGPLSISQWRSAILSSNIVLGFMLGIGAGCGLRQVAQGTTAIGAALRRLPTFTVLGAAYAVFLTWGDRTPEPVPEPIGEAAAACVVDSMGVGCATAEELDEDYKRALKLS